MQTLQEMLRDACEEAGDDVSFRNNYSGRGMYGRRCIGLDGSDSACNAIIGEVIKRMASSMVSAAKVSILSGSDADLADEEHFFEQAIGLLMNYNQDSMGLGTIIYWPQLYPIEEENQEIELHDADLSEG